ncbi:MAG: hypothetical protein U5K37_08175 [Natrialbaceae archaeon]|nr:hypothetical protein [Natrialbaceae archaeon]
MTGGRDPTLIYRELLGAAVLPELRYARRFRPIFWGGPRFTRRLFLRLWFRGVPKRTGQVIQGQRRYDRLRSDGMQFHSRIPGQKDR